MLNKNIVLHKIPVYRVPIYRLTVTFNRDHYRALAPLKTPKKVTENRFASFDGIVVDQIKLNAKNKNTTKSAQTWLNV